MDIFTIIISIFGTSFIWLIFVAVMFAIWMILQQRYTHLIKITSISAGGYITEVHKAIFKQHKLHGDIYYCPALKKANKETIPYFGTSYEYPMAKGKLKYVPLTYKDGTFAPETYDPKETVQKTFIEKVIKVDDKTKKSSVTFVKKTAMVTDYIVKPVKRNMRSFVLINDTDIKEQYNLQPGFWDKYGYIVMGMGIVFICAIVGIIIIVFGYQWAVDINQAPPWISQFLAAATNTTAPPGLAP